MAISLSADLFVLNQNPILVEYEEVCGRLNGHFLRDYCSQRLRYARYRWVYIVEIHSIWTGGHREREREREIRKL